MEKTNYFIGIDPISTEKSKGSLVTMKQNNDGSMEVVKVMKWYEKNDWLQKLIVKFYIWRMTNKFTRYYKNVTVLFEGNNSNVEKFKKKQLTNLSNKKHGQQ